MYQQASARKDRPRSAGFLSAPANMLSLRSTSGSSNSNVNNNNSTNLQTSSFMNGSHLTSNSTSSGNGTGTGGSNPSSPSKAASSSSHGGHHQHHHQQPTYIPTSAMIPAPLPGPSEEFYSTNFQEQQIPKHHQQHKDGQQQSHIRTLTAVSNPTIRPGVPQAKRPPHDPSSAPGVSFRSSLKPHSDASIPDIPYGSGQGRDQGKKRSVSISSNQPTSITNNTNTTTTSSTGGKARTFTPSDAHKGIRVLPQEAEKKNLHDNTSNNASNKPEHTTTIIASSSPAPSTQLFTPSAPLTVNAPVVPAGPQLVTNVNTTALEKNLTDNQAGSSAAAGKQPTKSALKQPQARSWADLVRPMNNIKLAEHTVKNIGLPEDMQNKDPAADAAMASFVASPEKKKRVSIAVPVASPSATASLADTNSATNAHDTTGADSAADTGADTISSEATAASTTAPAPAQPSVTSATDKSLKAAAGAGNGDHKHRKHDSSSRSTHSVNDARSIKSSTSTGTHGSVLDSYVSKKTRLEDILQGVENSSSSVLLYPRGLVNTGNACFMNAILQSLLFTGPFYNLISLIGANTSQDLSGKTPLLDAMVSYLSEFRATKDHSMQDQENHIHRGEAYEEPPSSHSSEAFIPSIIYHALNHNRRFAQMGFYNPTSSASSSLSNGSHKVGNAPITTSQINSNNRLSQEDAHEFLGFFLDTIHEELLIKIEQHDSLLWQKASKGAKAGQDIFSRESVNSIAAMNQSSPAHAQSQQNGDEDWLEVGTKGRTATTRTTEQQESAVTRIFGGQLRSVLRCPGSKDSVTLEPFTSLQLEIHHHGVTSIEDALSLISSSETISDMTNSNNVPVEATKQVFIDTLPPVLILHLKRFNYDSRAGGVVKSHKIVSFGTTFEIPKDCLAPAKRNIPIEMKKTKYRLAGVVYHHGKSATGGHYSVAIRQNNGRWINIDDTTITPISAEDVATDRDKETMRLSLPSAASLRGVPEKTAYLLFYQRI